MKVVLEIQVIMHAPCLCLMVDVVQVCLEFGDLGLWVLTSRLWLWRSGFSVVVFLLVIAPYL